MDIRKLREDLKLSQSEMAKKLGISPSTISQLEREALKLSERVNEKIKEVFNVDLFATESVKEEKIVQEKPVQEKPADKKTEIIVQSPMGGNITTKEILAKLPEGTDYVFVRVDQNKLWWIRGEETGSVDIWD